MCGRYAAAKSTDELVEELEVELDRTGDPVRSLLVSPQEPPPGAPDFNVAPTKNARVVLSRLQDGTAVRQMRLLTWGLVPSWSKDPRGGARMANARADTVLTKPAFAKAALARRALVPASGWYEWQVSPTATDAKGKPLKQPFFMHRMDGQSTVFAGLYEFWRDREAPEGDPMAWLATFTIITTDAEPGLDRIHDRQPLVLDRDQWGDWLDPTLTDRAAVGDILATRREGRFAAYPVSRAVGASRSNGPGLLTPLEASDLRGVVDPTTGEVIGS